MQLTGQQRIAVSRQRVWAALNDPEVLRASIPGCQSLEKEGDNRFNAIVEVKIGPIGARFKGAVTLSDFDPPNGYTIGGEGNAGVAGTAKGGAKVRLSDDGGATLVSYTVDAEVSGRLAQVGGPAIDATAKLLAAKFFENFARVLGGEAKPSVAASGGQPARTVSGGPVTSGGLPMGWVLALAVAALCGFLIGQGQAGAASNWQGLAMGLLVIVVAAAAFEHGRRTAAPILVLDAKLLAKLTKDSL
jgi:uncharacterized protein